MDEAIKNTIPLSGTGILVLKDGKALLGRRKGSHGAGEYAFPGGYLDHHESILDCVYREVAEEVGIKVKNPKFLCVMNVKVYAPKHFVGLGFVCEWESAEPKVLEPDKSESWDWYDMDKLPQPLFYTIPLIIEAYKTGRTFFDS